MGHYAVEDLRKSVRGAVLCPGEPGYDEARTIPNAMIDRRPAIIARCAGAATSSLAFASPVNTRSWFPFAAAAIALPENPFVKAV